MMLISNLPSYKFNSILLTKNLEGETRFSSNKPLADHFNFSPLNDNESVFTRASMDDRLVDFASDNTAPVTKPMIEALNEYLKGYHQTYSDDEYTFKAVQKFEDMFGKGAMTFFLNNGTSANLFGIALAIDSGDGVICTDLAHMSIRAGGWLTKNTGCAILNVPEKEGKLTVNSIKEAMKDYGSSGENNKNREMVISISQPTELGNYYSNEEVKQIADFAHENNMLLHLDGARLFSVAAATGQSLKELTTDLGVDIVYLGGTKSGMFNAESTVLTPNFFKNYVSLRSLIQNPFNKSSQTSLILDRGIFGLKGLRLQKQLGSLNARSGAGPTQFLKGFEKNEKGKMYAVQLSDQANQTARQLESELIKIKGIKRALPLDQEENPVNTTNVALVSMPASMKIYLDKKYKWIKTMKNPDPSRGEGFIIARFVTNPLTTEAQINKLTEYLKAYKTS